MLNALVLGQLLCGAVLIVSAVAKFRAPYAVKDALDALRLPKALRTSFVANSLPCVELLLGLGLILLTGLPQQVVAVATTLLFGCYTVIVWWALSFSDPVECACFGELGEPALTRRSLARNLLLIVASLAATAGAFAGISVWILFPADWVWVGMTALSVATVALIVARRSRASFGLDSQPSIGRFKLIDPQTDSWVRLDSGSKPRLLIFASSGCAACERIHEQLPDWRATGLTIDLVYPDVTDAPLPTGAMLDPGGNITAVLADGITPTALYWDGPGDTEFPIVGYDNIEEFVAGWASRNTASEAVPQLDYIRRPIPECLVLVEGQEPKTLLELAARRAQLLVSISTIDYQAEKIMANLGDWQQRLPQLQVALLTSLPRNSLDVELPVPVYYDHQGRAQYALGIRSNASGVLLGADGGLAGGPVSSAEVGSLVTEIETQLAG